MKKTHELIATLFLLSIGMQGCALVQNLREDLEDDSPKRSIASDFDYNSPENRNLPPPPATVQDDRISAVAGTPIDFSGIRAKSGRITKNDFINDVNKNENSLWSEDGQQNYLFARNKLKANGDLVTIKIEDGLRTDMVMEVKKLLPPEFRDRDIVMPGISKDVPEEAATDANRAVAGAAWGEKSSRASCGFHYSRGFGTLSERQLENSRNQEHSV